MPVGRGPTEWLKRWTEWKKELRSIRRSYTSLVTANQELLNATGSPYANKGMEWLSAYDKQDPASFRRTVDGLMDQTMPLFRQIHVFTGQRLKRILQNDTLFQGPLILDHIMRGQIKEMLPYPNRRVHDITPELKRQNYTVMRMFRMADEFFISLGLKEATQDFWNNSMFVKPEGRKVDCTPQAFDFNDGHKFRIKMCSQVTHGDFNNIHHEMGHIQHFMQYAHLVPAYREDSNRAFGEAIGEAMALSVESTKHLKAVGLMDQDAVEDDETELNFLMAIALETFPRMANVYLADRFRWDCFSKVTTAHNFNRHWWDLKCKYEGRIPPVQRSEYDFDMPTSRKSTGNTPLIEYFLSVVVKFQIYEALCNATNHVGPLHKCDFYNNKQAGQKLGDMLKVGSSKPWPEVLETLTGSRQIDLGSLLRYFAPLTQYLDNTVGEVPDWEDECTRTVPGLVDPDRLVDPVS